MTSLQVDRYVNVLKKIGHLNSTIDYLKVDVEGAEINFFTDIFTSNTNLLKNVKQIGMEIHAHGPGNNVFNKEHGSILCYPQSLTIS